MRIGKPVVSWLAAGALLLAGCGAGNQGGGSAAPGDTLRVPFSFDMQVPDPDVFFQAEGLNVTMAAYEGLLRHTPNAESPDIEPWLAESYTESDDGLSYTFKLREGVTFHDGTPLDAEAVKFSFERRKAVNAGPAQSLFAFDSVDVVDPLTVQINLTQPSSEFIPFLASAYGQKILSPTAVKEHETNGDMAQGWLSTHSAGTGPYEISSFSSGGYDLTAYDGYWGDKPGFPKVHISIDPSFTSQVLQLENGNLDVLTHGVPTADLTRLQDKGFAITTEPTFNRATIFLNPDTPAFKTSDGRKAIAAAIDRDVIVEQVYGEYAEVADQILMPGMLPEGTGRFSLQHDPQRASTFVSTLSDADKTIDIAYLSDDADNQQVGQLLQAQLQAAGLNATSRAITQPESFEYPTSPEQRPDMLLVGGISSDAAHPDPFPRLFYAHDGGLSYFQPQEVSKADSLLDQGRNARDIDAALPFYQQAADIYAASGLYIPFTDRPEVIVTRPGITGVEHEYNAVSAIRLASLQPTG